MSTMMLFDEQSKLAKGSTLFLLFWHPILSILYYEATMKIGLSIPSCEETKFPAKERITIKAAITVKSVQ